jgi:hypothetical protein
MRSQFRTPYLTMLIATIIGSCLVFVVGADEGVPYLNQTIVTINPVTDFDKLQGCSKWCLLGECSTGQSTVDCHDYRPNIGPADEGGSVIRKLDCSTAGCICSPADHFYQRIYNATYNCLYNSCYGNDKESSNFKPEADLMAKIITNYCTSHNLPGNYIYIYPGLSANSNITTGNSSPFTYTLGLRSDC